MKIVKASTGCVEVTYRGNVYLLTETACLDTTTVYQDLGDEVIPPYKLITYFFGGFMADGKAADNLLDLAKVYIDRDTPLTVMQAGLALQDKMKELGMTRKQFGWECLSHPFLSQGFTNGVIIRCNYSTHEVIVTK